MSHGAEVRRFKKRGINCDMAIVFMEDGCTMVIVTSDAPEGTKISGDIDGVFDRTQFPDHTLPEFRADPEDLIRAGYVEVPIWDDIL